MVRLRPRRRRAGDGQPPGARPLPGVGRPACLQSPPANEGDAMDETVIEIAEAVRSGERKASEVLDAALAAIEDHNGRLGAFVHVDEALARETAAAIDAAVADGRDP